MGCATIPAGYRGVKVYYYGDSDGNETRELGIGRYPYWPLTQTIYKFPVFQQNVLWAGDEGGVRFQAREGVNVSVDLGMSYTIDPKKVTVLFQTYRRGIEEITDSFLRHIVVDACTRVAGTMGIEEIYGTQKGEFIRRVNEDVAAQVRPNGLRVDRIYLVGQFRLPAAVVQAIDTKIAATQRAQQRENELRETEAESAKRIAQARGTAESERIAAEAKAKVIEALTQRLTPEYLQYQAIQRWDGQLPTHMLGDRLPFVGTISTAEGKSDGARGEGAAKPERPRVPAAPKTNKGEP